MRSSGRSWLSLAVATALMLVGSQLAVLNTATAASRTATAATVYYWNGVLLEAFRRDGGEVGPLSRAAAMVHAGIFDVLNSAQWSRQGGLGRGFNGYRFIGTVDARVDDDLAAGIAARDLLIAALPSQRSFVLQRYAQRHGTASQAAASSLANSVADRIIEDRTGDGSGATVSYQFDRVPGGWRLTGNGCTSPVTPQWGAVEPFTLTSNTQFRQPLPGGFATYAGLLASPFYASDVNEVKSLGRAGDTSPRTAEQTRIAFFWANDLDGTSKTPGQLLEHTRIVSAGRVTDPVRLARLFAHASLALADAAIAAWDQKYRTRIDLWRPETAIQQAADDNNPATTPDSDWRPLSQNQSGVHFSPCFPSWVSGHATFAAAWAGVMRDTLGNQVTYTATTEDPNAVGVTRRFTTFTQAAAENARSRVYLGVHYQFDADDGLVTGYGIGDHVVDNFLETLDCPQLCF